MKKKILNILKILFFIGLGIFFIVWFWQKMNPQEKADLITSFKTANYFWFLVSIFLCLLSHLLRSLRWRQLLHPMGYNPRLRITFSAVMVGYMANLAIPRLGEVMRCGILNRYEKIPLEKSLGTVVTERAIDMLTFLLFALFALLLEYDLLKDYIYNSLTKIIDPSGIWKILALGGALFAIAVLLLWIFRKPLGKIKFVVKIKTIALGFLEGIRSIFKLKNPLLFILYSVSIWLTYLVSLYVVFRCFPETSVLSLKAGLVALVIGSLGVMVTPGGIGLYPVLIGEALKIYSIDIAIGYAIGWIAWIGQQLTVISIGMASLIGLSIASHKKHDKDTTPPKV